MILANKGGHAEKFAEAHPVVVAGVRLEMETLAIDVKVKIRTDNLQCKANTEKEGLRLDAIRDITKLLVKDKSPTGLAMRRTMMLLKRDITKLLVKDKSPTGLAMRRTMMLLKPEGSQVTLPTGVYRIGLQELVDAKLVVVNPYETEKLVAFSLTPLGREVAKLLEWEMARR